MLDSELEVCPDCGTLHLEGGPGPHDVDTCANCGGRLRDVDLGDIVDL